VSLYIAIEQNGRAVGNIDCDGRFHFVAAPNLRTALGWSLATDGGRERLIEFFDLDQAANALLSVIRANGVERVVFFGPYFETLAHIFVSGRTSRFGDGCNGPASTLWRVATRELGEEHFGYSFYH
jgi:hypothetical protein